MCIKYFEKLPMFYYRGEKYYEWQDDDYVRIGFSDFPDISNKLINKNVMNADEIKQAKKKPLILKNSVDVCLIEKQILHSSFSTLTPTAQPPLIFELTMSVKGGLSPRKWARGEIRVPVLGRGEEKKNGVYTFTIPAGYDYDGASIPHFLWRFIGSKENIEFKVAALIHDVLCENHNYVDNNRYFADKVFERLLEVGDVSVFKRWLMFHSVDNFQKFCHW